MNKSQKKKSLQIKNLKFSSLTFYNYSKIYFNFKLIKKIKKKTKKIKKKFSHFFFNSNINTQK